MAPGLTKGFRVHGRYTKTKRAIQSAYAALLVGLAESLPLGILQANTPQHPSLTASIFFGHPAGMCCAVRMDVRMRHATYKSIQSCVP